MGQGVTARVHSYRLGRQAIHLTHISRASGAALLLQGAALYLHLQRASRRHGDWTPVTGGSRPCAHEAGHAARHRARLVTTRGRRSAWVGSGVGREEKDGGSVGVSRTSPCHGNTLRTVHGAKSRKRMCETTVFRVHVNRSQ